MLNFLKQQFKGYKYIDTLNYETVINDVAIDNNKVIFKLDWEGVRVNSNLSELISDCKNNNISIIEKFTPLIGKPFLDYKNNEYAIYKITKHIACGLEFHFRSTKDTTIEHTLDLDELALVFKGFIK